MLHLLFHGVFFYFTVFNDSAVGINMTEPCQYPVPIGLEKDYVPNENIWVTTQINELRGAQYGRLRGWKGMFVILL